MRSFVVAMTIAGILIVGGVFFNISLNKLSGELFEASSQIEEYINNGDFEKASESISELSEYVDKKKPILASIISHDNIDDIEVCISELWGYTDNSSLVDSIAQCRKLEHLFEHLPSNYGLKAENIL